MTRAILTRFGAVGFGILLFLVLAEIISRAVFSQIVNFDVEMWKYAREMKMPGRSPGIRFEHKANSHARLMGVIIRTNSAGMRDREFTHEAGADTVRIAVLGDSITLGWGVDQERTFPKVLEVLLNSRLHLPGVKRYEVMNFGVGNYNIADEFRLLQARVVAFHPDILLVASFLNDAEASPSTRGNLLLRESVFAVWLWGRMDSILRRAGLRDDYLQYYRGLYEPGGGGWTRFSEGVERIAAVCRERNITLLSVILPELHQLHDYPFSDIHRKIGLMFRKAGAQSLDLLTSLDGSPAVGFQVASDDAHPNEEAHRRFAHAIFSGFDWKRIVLSGRSR